jgi:type I restriction enzyme S subunit
MLRATNIKRGRIDENGLLRVKRAAIPQNRNPYLKCGDILVVRSGAYTGDVAMITEQWEGCIAGYDLVVSPGKAMDAKCCSYNLLSEQAQRYFRSQRDRSAQPHLNRGQLENTLIPLADIGEQHKIANILDAFDTKLASEEAYMSALSQLFESLLHRLMTGRIRLPEFAGGD